MPERNQVFVSYSHKDKKAKERLEDYLTYHVTNENLKVWFDTEIKPGDKTKKLVNRKLISYFLSLRKHILTSSLNFRYSHNVSNPLISPHLPKQNL